MTTRREFLRMSLGGTLLSLAPSVPWALLRPTAQAADRAAANGRVLVVLQLSGGNDGLNTVVPYEDEAYARLRPTLRLNPADLHPLKPGLGLHPRMGAFRRLFEKGQLTVVQGVGCPDQSRDHERAMLAWQTASTESDGIDTGWLGRAADQLWSASQPLAPGVYVGNISRPFGINAATVVIPTIRRAREAYLFRETTQRSGRADEEDNDGERLAPDTARNPLWRHVRVALGEARRSQSHLDVVLKSASSAAPYPQFGLAEDLRTIANLVRAEVGIQIFYTELGGGGIGGFDNHANQIGNHCALLEQLSDSIAAFVSDLARDRLLDRVLLMTFSEFGRTAAENGRRGTDHGVAGPVFLAGGKVRGGIHGAHPSLTDLDAGALRGHTDFRSLYATLLEEWLQLPSEPILGRRFPRLPLV